MKKMFLGLLSLSLIAATSPATQQAPSADIAIGKSIEAGNAVDTASAFDGTVGQLAGWTRITGMTAGSKVTHAWIHGSDTSRIELNIGGSPWRTYSRKTISAGATGNWTFEVWGPDGGKLGSKSFTIR